MIELNARDCGLIAAALREYAEDHPDMDTADHAEALADIIETHTITATRASTGPHWTDAVS